MPLAVIAADAGVGVSTLYRKYADRDALMQALEYRAYGLLGRILNDTSRRDLPGPARPTEVPSGGSRPGR